MMWMSLYRDAMRWGAMTNDEFDQEAQGLWKEFNWRIMGHNHSTMYSPDKCPLCVIEDALWGWRK